MLPDIKNYEFGGGNKWTFNIYLAPTLIYFEGHFDEQAVLPGVVQIEWIVKLAERALAKPLLFAGMRNIKFMHIMKPNLDLQVVIEFLPEKSQLKFCYLRKSKEYSKGIIEVGIDDV